MIDWYLKKVMSRCWVNWLGACSICYLIIWGPKIQNIVYGTWYRDDWLIWVLGDLFWPCVVKAYFLFWWLVENRTGDPEHELLRKIFIFNVPPQTDSTHLRNRSPKKLPFCFNDILTLVLTVSCASFLNVRSGSCRTGIMLPYPYRHTGQVDLYI